MYGIAVKCVVCNHRHILHVGLEALMRWRENADPDELADLPAADRELMLSQMCPAHYNYPELEDH